MTKKKQTWPAWLFIGVALLLIVVALSDTDTPERPEPAADESVTTPGPTPEEEYVNGLLVAETMLASFEPARRDVDEILYEISLFSAWALLIERAPRLDLTDDQRRRVEAFRAGVQRLQRTEFPALRDAYGPAARRVLWEDDIEARTFGRRFTVIEFVGGLFAANRNIKRFQEEIRIVMHKLRFEQVRYKWYEGEDEYSYYALSPEPDEALVVWLEGDEFRVVEPN